MKKKRILLVISSLTGGGAQRVFAYLANYLDSKNYNVILITVEDILDYREELSSSIIISNLDKKNRWDFLKLILKLRMAINYYKPEVIISFLNYANIIALIATMFLNRKLRTIISVRSHPLMYLSEARLALIKRWLIRFTYKRADTIVAVSKSIKRVLKKDFSLESDKIITIYNPVPIEAIRYKSNQQIDHPFFKLKNSCVIISVGRLNKQKRFDILLKAFSLVKSKFDNVCLIILGKGELYSELLTLSSQLKINKWVDFVGFKSNPYAWISNANIFVLSSDWEGFPNVLLEAMACGVPIISTDCPSGPNELISNGKNGILVPPSNEKALAKAMLTLLVDKELRSKLSQGGRIRVEDFRMKSILPQYEALIYRAERECQTFRPTF